MLRRRLLSVLAISVLVLGLAGCGPGEAPDARPKIIRIAMSVNEEIVEERATAYQELADYLGQKLNLKVEVVETQGYGTAIEAMRAGKIDVCTSSPMPYLVARNKTNVVPLVVPGMPDGAPSSYYSIFITHSESGIRTMDDLKARAASLTLAFADPASTSGHLIPRAHLESLGIDAERDFKRVIFSNIHTASMMSVQARKADVAAVTKTLYDRMIRDGRAQEKDFHVLWVSKPLRQTVVYARGELPPDLLEELRAAYLSLATERPEIWKGLRTRSTSGAVGYVPADDAMFDEFRRLARNLEHIKLLD
jgi:phosphonate transport system substrate-binding protein